MAIQVARVFDLSADGVGSMAVIRAVGVAILRPSRVVVASTRRRASARISSRRPSTARWARNAARGAGRSNPRSPRRRSPRPSASHRVHRTGRSTPPAAGFRFQRSVRMPLGRLLRVGRLDIESAGAVLHMPRTEARQCSDVSGCAGAYRQGRCHGNGNSAGARLTIEGSRDGRWVCGVSMRERLVGVSTALIFVAARWL